ncbi:RNA polymerase sigma-B factor [Actinoplanes lutulentus]|uniref:Anti-sigma factor antagonist n=1 Tax=Actinoplanes lutulentus TaxID=1287878 RepID=A0A327ZJ67_9ACTN|nr:SigB/SigF/SigG family RNA polymerase sigma factor [Actinoplanes lutulentus]MBB2944068.1 RNA polymerase sigma-B factor [Actinoplanes lutulentus]RAK42699.1 RNA polymerase sigma-B factor [Actinoplanes lutulentus]
MSARRPAGESADTAFEDLDVAAAEYAERRAAASPAQMDSLREDLIRHCLPFAGRLARRYRNRGEYLEDLEQVARLGLVKAIDRYDPERGSFTAYAVITISGELKRHFRDRTWGVHVPRRVQDLSLEVGHASMVLTSVLARTPTIAELAERLGVGEAAVLDAVESAAGYSPASLNAPVAGDGVAEFGDLIGDLDGDLESVTDKLTVMELLLRVPARERRMLAMRFYGNRTQAEIATELGISQMHVSRLLSRALSWLREAMLSDTPPRWDGGEPRAAPHGMQVTVDKDGATMVVRVRGEVDRDNAERLRTALRHATGSGASAVVVDFAGVPLVDAAGVAVLVDAVQAAGAASVDIAVSGAQQYVARTLAVSGLENVLRRASDRV